MKVSKNAKNCVSKDKLTKKLPYRNNVGALIFKGDKYLLVQRINWPDNFWKLPRGGIDEKENKVSAILRELREELGTDKFKVIKLFPFKHQYDWDKENIDLAGSRFRGQKQSFFSIEFIGKNISLNLIELKNYCWVTKDELLEKVDISHPLFKGYKRVVKKLLQ